MNGIAEIDKAGRLVIPKKIRDAMHLRAGDRLSLEYTGESLVVDMERKAKGLFKDGGVWVYDSGVPFTEEEASRWVTEDRERRMKFVSGESDEP
jgi:AbrB family looped-hinge helix DNA binding protein